MHNCRKGEANQAFTDEWTDEQNVIFSYSGILFSLKYEGHSDTCLMDKPSGP